ncbi:hypothetical protein ACFSUK_07335 [Sphingobium scionense]
MLKHDLGRVLLKLEEAQEAEIATALAPEDRPGMSAPSGRRRWRS